MGPRTSALRELLAALRDARRRIAEGQERVRRSLVKQGDAALAGAVADHSRASAALADFMLARDEAGVALELELVALALETPRPGDEPWTNAARARLAGEMRRMGGLS